MDVEPLVAVPEILIVEPPRLPKQLLERAEQLHQELLSRPEGYDDPVLVGLEADAERIVAYEAPYSLARTLYAAADPRFGVGTVAAKLMLSSPHGLEWLWQLRTEHVLEADRWSWAAAGGVDPGEDPLQAVRREAQEELGIAASALEGLEPLALVGSPGLAILFRARLAPRVELHPNAHEVAELRFASAPPEPCTRTVAAVWDRVAAISGARDAVSSQAL